MVTQARPSPKPPSRSRLRQIWANGWGARLILIGSLLSFSSLFASWGIVVQGVGWSEYHHGDGRPITILPHAGTTWSEHVGANTVVGGSAFDVDPTSARLFAALMALSAHVASKPPQRDRGAIRWVPMACTAFLLFSGVTTVVKLVNETQSYLVHRTKQMVHHLFGASRCTAQKLVGRLVQTDESSVWVGPLVDAPSGFWAAQGMGPFLLIACQVLAGLGGLPFLRGRPALPA